MRPSADSEPAEKPAITTSGFFFLIQLTNSFLEFLHLPAHSLCLLFQKVQFPLGTHGGRDKGPGIWGLICPGGSEGGHAQGSPLPTGQTSGVVPVPSLRGIAITSYHGLCMWITVFRATAGVRPTTTSTTTRHHKGLFC